MHQFYYLTAMLVRSRQQASEAGHDNPWSQPWSDDESTDNTDAIKRRNRTIQQRLGSQFPDVDFDQEWRPEYELLNIGDPDADTVLLRQHRSNAVSGNWDHGGWLVEIYDELMLVVVKLDRFSDDREAALVNDLQSLFQLIHEASGFLPWNQELCRTEQPLDAASGLIAAHHEGLAELAKHNRRQRRRRAAGLPSLLILTLLALVSSGVLAWSAIDQGTLSINADATQQLTFVTERVPPPEMKLGIFPRFYLQGHIAGQEEAATLRVYRDQVIRAGPGARYTVVPTGKPEVPYVLRSKLDSIGPVAQIGDYGVNWLVLLASLPIALWYWILARPQGYSDPRDRAEIYERATTSLLGLLKILAFIGVILAVPVWI